MPRLPKAALAAFVGIAWAEAQQAVCLQAAGAHTREFMILAHTPEAIAEWACTIRKRCDGRPIAVGLELHQGALVYALRKYELRVVFPIHPLTLATDRDAFPPSHAKDDPTDAELQLELLLTHPDQLQPLQSQSPAMRALEQRVEHRRRLVGDTGRLTHRLTSALKTYFPQVLQWFDEKDTTIFCDFLAQGPPLQAVQLARRPTLEGCFRAHHVRYAEVSDRRVRAIKSAIPLPTAEGMIAPMPSSFRPSSLSGG